MNTQYTNDSPYSEFQPAYPPLDGYSPTRPYGPPVVSQPLSNLQHYVNEGGWGATAGPLPNCPPGLEPLTTVDHLLVQEKIKAWKFGKSYIVKNHLGHNLYYAVEDLDCCPLCASDTSWRMKIQDGSEREIINLRLPLLTCNLCCCSDTYQKLEVFSPPGRLVGSVSQEWTCFTDSFTVNNSGGDVVLLIKGPGFSCNSCRSIEFKVLSRDGHTSVGKISKQWRGLAKELFSNADYFGISFPMDLDVQMKAVMLGACFLIARNFNEQQRSSD